MKCLETPINHFIHAMICKSRQKKKKECYPPSTCGERSLQSPIQNTITRLSIALEEILCSLNDNEQTSLKIICKGYDRSQQAKYKQCFQEASDTGY